MKRVIFPFLLLAFLFCTCSDGSTPNIAPISTHFELSFEPEDHYIYVTMTVNGAEPGTTRLKMPVWAPGYYIILDSPKHLTQFAAADSQGKELAWTKEGKTCWAVENGDESSFTVSYRIYANNQSVGEAFVDGQKAFLTGNEVFLYIDGCKEASATVRVNLPDGWSGACSGLKSQPDGSFFAPDYDTLVDSPIFAGCPVVHHFESDGHGYTLCVADSTGLDLNAYEDELKRMMRAATDMMGDVPYENYCYLWLWRGRGGLEHINSQACFTDDGLYSSNRDEHRGWMNFVTHEYFHLYNVKTIRPFELGPFDYDRECYTDQLWVSEGLTCYYELALMRRAGLSTKDEMIADWMEFVRDTEKNEGRKNMSLAQSSYDIWLNFFNTDPSIDRISYYVKGPVIGMLMDLAIRQATENRRSLDDLMRLLYNRFYKEQSRGFHTDEFWAAVQEVAEGNSLDDIKALVYTTEEIDYDKFLGYAGLSLDRDNWTLVPIEHPTELQQSIQTAVFGDTDVSQG